MKYHTRSDNQGEAIQSTQEEERGSRLRASGRTFMISLCDKIGNELYNNRT